MLSSLELGRVRPLSCRSRSSRPRLTLSFPSQAYLTDSLSRAQLGVLQDLAEYGLVFYPDVRPRSLLRRRTAR